MHGRGGLSSVGELATLVWSLALGGGVAAAVSPAPVPRPAGGPSDVKIEAADTAPAVKDLQQTVEQQRQAIARLEALLEALERRLAQLESSTAARPEPPAAAAAPAVQTGAVPTVEKRLSSLGRSLERLPEAVRTDISGEFPGAFPIPGTDAALKIGGRVTYTAVHNLDPLGVDDRFVTAAIPVGSTEADGMSSRTAYTANPTRLNFDFRTPTGVGAMRAFVEGDFRGPDNSFSLRHAFGQWRRISAGQTWSTFSDPEAAPQVTIERTDWFHQCSYPT